MAQPESESGMRQDAKLALAMAMLVIGFALAFCFPRQPAISPESTPDVPFPSRADDLAYLPMRAYASSPQPRSPRNDAILPTPAKLAPGPSVLVPEAGIELKPDSAAEGTSSEAATQAIRTSSPSQDGLQKHVVRSGDTLSGLAIRYLGSSQRYLEIFEANRHLLATPDDLRIGMELRIPARNGSTRAPQGPVNLILTESETGITRIADPAAPRQVADETGMAGPTSPQTATRIEDPVLR